uniref:C2H2-type domain-containing protein n=1 Tax=Setaria digitata TaxID=48799 RepID=A0A915PNV0_9BILA
MAEAPSHHRTRKRRRGEAVNPANTLDGLVAKRADDRVEIDPDVSTRTCSICGYQGKWVSEMIRHKRVHTNERPFRCKYCSRTSKWKADLVRHVAKTHGIRVVSKYSRSKTFRNSASSLDTDNNRTERKKTCIEIFTDLKDGEKVALGCRKPKSLRLRTMYRCVICLFEQDSVLVLISHLKNAHNVLPYECHSCGSSFMDAHTTMKHFIENTTCRRNPKPPFALLDEAARRAAYELFNKTSVITSLTASSTKSIKNAPQNATLPVAPVEKYEMNQSDTYNNLNEMFFNCSFSNWTAKKMCIWEEYMHIHGPANPSSPIQSVDGAFSNSPEVKRKVSPDRAAGTEQTLATPSRHLDFGTLLSLLKQQSTFNPLFPIQALGPKSTRLSEWVTPGPSAFKQVTPASEETASVRASESYEMQQKKTSLELSLLLSDTFNNLPCSSVTVISNSTPNSQSKNFCFVNSNPSDRREKLNANCKTTDVSSLHSYCVSEEVNKAIQYYRQRRNAPFSPIPVEETKIQRSDDSPRSSEGKTNESGRNKTKKEEDVFVDVVQLD